MSFLIQSWNDDADRSSLIFLDKSVCFIAFNHCNCLMHKNDAIYKVNDPDDKMVRLQDSFPVCVPTTTMMATASTVFRVLSHKLKSILG